MQKEPGQKQEVPLWAIAFLGLLPAVCVLLYVILTIETRLIVGAWHFPYFP